MRRRIYFGPWRPAVFIPVARKSCEHVCFTGAALDLVAYCIHWEVFAIMFVGKLAFVCGALGIYCLHVEEHWTGHE